MAIEFDRFLNWAESRFGGDVVVRGNEIMVNSIFCEDYKHHLWCNVFGGKDQLPNGVYHCWKSNESGSLISLVMKVDNCSYEEAIEILGTEDIKFMELQEKVNAMFLQKFEPKEEIKGSLSLPDNTHWINELEPSNVWRVEAEDYLNKRKLDCNDYMVCTGGNYRNRIIIPYFDKNKNLIYWNARLMAKGNSKVPKYLGPNKEEGIGKGDVIYMPVWPQDGVQLYVTEGEFDAKSIQMSGLFSAAIGGKELSDKQVLYLRPYIPVLCFDTDAGKRQDAGKNALKAIGHTLKSEGFEQVYYIRPPAQYKDWNKMLIETSPKFIAAYINKYKKAYTTDTEIKLEL
ncbi:MAG: hypothetical protein DWQ19_12470 [Crenarchaeota archaeon]|nr:MAG: hypothetical protein DWQ19_12470 [Thermoproteota archaeon]